MSGRIENLGLEVLAHNEQEAATIISSVVVEGKTVQGYYNKPYINKTFKDVEFIIRTDHNDIDGKNEIAGIDVHCAGGCVWDAEILEDLTLAESGETEKRILVKDIGNKSGMAVVNIIKSDVLPTYQRGAKIKMQVAAFPTSLEIIESKEDDKVEYIFPTVLEKNIDESGHFNKSDIEEINIVKGHIHRMRYGRFEFNGELHKPFVILTVGTQFGELDLAVSHNTIKEIGAEKFVEGATVSAEAVLTGDVAIYEYEQGMIRDEEYDLKAIAYALAEGGSERIKKILSDECIYESTEGGWQEIGALQVVRRINDISSTLRGTISTRIAEISAKTDEDAINKCIVIEYRDGSRSLVFVEYDLNKKIKSITVKNSSDFEFKIVD